MTDDEAMTPARAAVRLLILSAVFPLFLFPFAGRWDWGVAWILIITLIVATLVSRWLAFREHPDLLDERASSFGAEDAKPWDKVLSPAMGITPLLVLIVAGLDERFGWTAHWGFGVQITGLIFVIVGYALATWAMVVNEFFSGVVRIQTERGHHVVDSGPYAIVRHPGYTGNLLACLGFPLALSSLWAFVPFALVLIVTVTRTSLEDRTLNDELPGYPDFATRTRYRLIPGVW